MVLFRIFLCRTFDSDNEGSMNNLIILILNYCSIKSKISFFKNWAMFMRVVFKCKFMFACRVSRSGSWTRSFLTKTILFP